MSKPANQLWKRYIPISYLTSPRNRCKYLLSGHPRPWSCPVQRGIQLLDRENIQFNEDTEEDQLVRAMVRNVATQNHALSGGGADAGLLTP
jgi:hypothetical protein